MGERLPQTIRPRKETEALTPEANSLRLGSGNCPHRTRMSPEVQQRVPVVAIDGPVGVGKSSVARRVAETLGFRHLDTGAMYRAVSVRLLEQDAEERKSGTAARIARNEAIELRQDGRVWIGARDVTEAIREEEVSQHVHLVADDAAVRQALVAQQRRIGLERPSVLEGRDIGTVVFPDAKWKVYLDASPDVRAQRRAAQHVANSRKVPLGQVLKNLTERDQRDRERKVGPLRVADDATVIDTTDMTEDRVIELICAIVRASDARPAP